MLRFIGGDARRYRIFAMLDYAAIELLYQVAAIDTLLITPFFIDAERAMLISIQRRLDTRRR